MRPISSGLLYLVFRYGSAFTAISVPALAEPWTINYPASSITITPKAWGFSPSDLAFEEFSAQVALDEQGELSQADFDFSYPKLTSGYPRRDRRVHEWLQADRFPEGRFRFERVIDEEGQRIAVGQLTLHGQTHEARFVFSIASLPDAPARLDAVAHIDYRDWGLPTLRILIFTIDPILKITLAIEAEPCRKNLD